jgi:hypothetical protein
MFCLRHWYTELVPVEPLISFLHSFEWRELTACCKSVKLLRVSVTFNEGWWWETPNTLTLLEGETI